MSKGVKNIKNHLTILKDLSIDSTTYLNLKILLEYLFELETKHFVS